MIVAMLEHAMEAQIDNVVSRMMDLGFSVHKSTGTAQTPDQFAKLMDELRIIAPAVGKRIA